ncbi:MAG: DUF3990 domain-containing protein [Propionibacteriaceae bacterium]|jgi:hypothetical protein|nr:DUF3990 domain-containing protein [Propionibacteriaceae bacterium]
MKLYHGTDVVIDEPRVLVPNRALDFGQGFYTTSDFGQARRWALAVARRHKTSTPLIHQYNFDESANDLRVRHFQTATVEWLDFVAAHRLGTFRGPSYDLVIGPVANDRTIPVIQQYMQAEDKALFAPAAIALIKPETLADQYVFTTAHALSHLNLVEVTHA